jgi:hypothetical protein
MYLTAVVPNRSNIKHGGMKRDSEQAEKSKDERHTQIAPVGGQYLQNEGGTLKTVGNEGGTQSEMNGGGRGKQNRERNVGVEDHDASENG